MSEAAGEGAREPAVVTAFLTRMSRERWRPAFLHVAQDGRVLAAGGALDLYGLSALSIGAVCADELPLLFGVLPLPPGSEPFLLPWVNTDAGGYMDVHVLPGDGCDYVVFLEAAVDQQERVEMQRIGNELALRQHRQGHLLETHVGKYVAEQLMSGGFALREEGERREATLLFADLRGFTAFAEQHPPQLVFQTLNRLMQAMVQPILDHSGWLDKIAGDAVYAAFGLIPPRSEHAQVAPPRLALTAAQQIMRGLRSLNEERRRDGLSPLGVGIGISTGVVAVGILGTEERRQFAVIGHHVNVAARLQAQAQAGEIIIDHSTYAVLGDAAAAFVERPQRLKGVLDVVMAHALLTEL